METPLGWAMKLLRDLPTSRGGSEGEPRGDSSSHQSQSFPWGDHESDGRSRELCCLGPSAPDKGSCCGGKGGEAEGKGWYVPLCMPHPSQASPGASLLN